MRVFLETPRLVLRRFTPAGVDNLVSLNADPTLCGILTGGMPAGRDEIENELLPAFPGYYERSDTKASFERCRNLRERQARASIHQDHAVGRGEGKFRETSPA